MLKFKRVKGSDKLADQFGMDEKAFEQVGGLWKEVFDAIDDLITGQVKASLNADEDGFEFDATAAFDIFFEKFNTEELQNIALIQLLMNDVNRRAGRAIKNAMKEHVFGEGGLAAMLEAMAGNLAEEKEEGQDDEGGFDEDLL